VYFALSREHAKVTPDCVSEYVNAAEDEVVGLVGLDLIAGAGIAIDHV
jgi:hypothetical protein